MTRASATHRPSSEKTRTLRPGAGHETELGKPGAGQASGHGADWLHVDQAGRPAEVEDVLRRFGRVGDRCGVGHGEHGGVAADRRGGRAGGDGLGVLAAGFAQVGVQVDETGQSDEPVGVDDLRARARAVTERADGVDAPVLEQQVGRLSAEQAARP